MPGVVEPHASELVVRLELLADVPSEPSPSAREGVREGVRDLAPEVVSRVRGVPEVVRGVEVECPRVA